MGVDSFQVHLTELQSVLKRNWVLHITKQVYSQSENIDQILTTAIFLFYLCNQYNNSRLNFSHVFRRKENYKQTYTGSQRPFLSMLFLFL